MYCIFLLESTNFIINIIFGHGTLCLRHLVRMVKFDSFHLRFWCSKFFMLVDSSMFILFGYFIFEIQGWITLNLKKLILRAATLVIRPHNVNVVNQWWLVIFDFILFFIFGTFEIDFYLIIDRRWRQKVILTFINVDHRLLVLGKHFLNFLLFIIFLLVHAIWHGLWLILVEQLRTILWHDKVILDLPLWLQRWRIYRKSVRCSLIIKLEAFFIFVSHVHEAVVVFVIECEPLFHF